MNGHAETRATAELLRRSRKEREQAAATSAEYTRIDQQINKHRERSTRS